jgi:EmrB/QacA subfamily drug resistance transporter
MRFLTSPGAAISLLVAGAFFMENLDGTVVVTALPQMAETFGVHPVDLNIGVSSYMLTLAILIPASGWVADRFGLRTVFAAAIGVFTLASILCGYCHSLETFVLARILQGAGGAMMVPVGRLAVLRTTEKHDLLNAIAIITWPGLAAPMLGPPVGGFITTYASWPWIFFLNVPLGLIALPLALRLIPNTKSEAPQFDWVGFALTGAACFLIIYGVGLVGQNSGSPWFGATSVLSGVAFGIVAAAHARRRPNALLDFRALKIRSYAVSIYGGSLFRVAIATVPFLLPLLFQIAFGLSPFESGLLVLAVFAGNLGMKPFTTAVLRRWSFRRVLMVNGLLNAVAIFGCGLLTPETPLTIIVALLFVSGLVRSMQFTALAAIGFAEVPSGQMSGANTLQNIAGQLSMGLGIGVGALVLRIAGYFSLDPQGAVSLWSFHIAFFVNAAIALIGVADVFSLHDTAGEDVRLRSAAANATPVGSGASK